MQISLRGIANRAKRLKDYRFLNLSTMLNEYNLLDSWQYVKKNVAYGVDKVSAREIERDLQSQVGSLVERLKRKSYRAKLVRRPRITQQRNYQLNFQRALCWCGSEYYWRARCGKTARRDLYGGRRVTGVPTVTKKTEDRGRRTEDRRRRGLQRWAMKDGAPRKAWHLWQSESLCWVRFNQPPIPSVEGM